MKRQILLLAITAAALSSCTTAYRTGQTPDDVYFSPAKPQDEYVRVEDDREEYRYNDDYYDDRYLRMKVRNRAQWDYLDDWYGYDRYSYHASRYYGSYYNPYTSWNYYYNPYCNRYNNVIIYNPKQTQSIANVPKPKNFNLTSYTNANYNNANSGVRMNSFKPGATVNRPVYNNSNSGRGFSNTIKQIFSGNNSSSNNNSNNSYSPPSRTYTPSTPSSSGSSGSSGSSSGSSGSGTSRPSRGN